MRTLLAILLLLLTGCATMNPTTPADAFFARVSSLCGKAFEGRIVSPAEEANRDFLGKRLVMHVRECSADTIRIPFHVDDNRSRTFVLTRTAAGLRLKHVHRHEDGSEETMSQYGGDTMTPGSSSRQDFPSDRYSRELVVRENVPERAANVWGWEVQPERLFAFELRRPNRFLRVAFDLRRPVTVPPAPWGSR
jgi:hypothetical protein